MKTLNALLIFISAYRPSEYLLLNEGGPGGGGEDTTRTSVYPKVSLILKKKGDRRLKNIMGVLQALSAVSTSENFYDCQNQSKVNIFLPSANDISMTVE